MRGVAGYDSPTKGTITVSMTPLPHDLSTLQSLAWPTMLIIIVVVLRVPARALPGICHAAIAQVRRP